MNDTPTLDDLEREVARTLHAKADQIAVDDAPFSAEAATRGEVVRFTSTRSRRRGALAVAAAAIVVAGAVSLVHRLTSVDETDVAMLDATAGVSYGLRAVGTAGFVPATLPDGWTLQQMSVGSTLSVPRARWQLFGDGAGALGRGVLVGSTANDEGRVIPGPNDTIHDRPTLVRASADPQAPAGALEASWIEGDLVHDAIAVGMTEAELVAVLDSLVPHEDPTSGFRSVAGSGLSEIDAVTVDDTYSSSLTYVGPAGRTDTVRVTAESPDHYGGLLHRLAGEPRGDGFLLHGQTGGDPGYPFVSLARDDGWTVEVLSTRSQTVAQDPGLLDVILDRLEPATGQQLIDVGLAQPVTTTHAVGGWTIDIHGTDTDDLAMCITPAAGETVCSTAQNAPGAPGLTTGSASVGDEWIVVAVTDGAGPATVRTAPSSGLDRPENFSPDDLRGEQERSGDRVVEVFTVPPDVDAVDVMIPAKDGEAAGFTHDRPVG
jgi:hypothetical protein